MDSRPPEEMPRSAEAGHWFARMQAGDCSVAERAACRRWREADPANDVAYVQVERIFQGSLELRRSAAFRGEADRIRERSIRRAQRRRLWKWGGRLGAAAAVVLALGIGWQRWDPVQPEQRYASAVGEQRSLALDDGSRVLLDTDTVLRVQYSRKRRNLVLERGQAQFTVAPAPDRPFTVRTALGEVRAIGTRFQVRAYADRVQVNLLEGVVEVSAAGAAPREAPRRATLAAGEQLLFGARDQWIRAPLDQEVAQGWTRGELIFRQTPLAQLVEEMNRYSSVRMELADPALGEMRLNGMFQGSDQESLLQVMEQVWSLRVERAAPDRIVVHRR